MKRILIVDDLEQNRYLLEATLRGYGYEVVSACDGVEALDAARREPPALVISDILMPLMDGFALCRQWRRDARLCDIPFVFYTATYTDPKDEQLALDLGADRFVLKPQEPQVMNEILLDVLARGTRTPVPGAPGVLPDEIVTLREYNEALVRKLEKKLKELELTHQQLLLDVQERKRADQALRDSERRYRTLLELETKLSAAREPVEAAWIIFEAADKLWTFDAGALDVYLPDQDLVQVVLDLDIMEGTRREVRQMQPISKPSTRFNRIMKQGAELILRQPPFTPQADAIMFGDTSRPSASIISVPIRWKEQPVGVLSVQSYKPNAFTEADLRTLQGLADHCGGTLERIRVNEALRASEAQFRQAQKMEAIGQLAGGVAHDFNNILGAILGNAQLALADTPEAHPAREGMEQILKAGMRAKTLVQQILTFSRQQPQERRVIALEPLIMEAASFLHATIPAGVQVVTVMGPDAPPVLADPTQIHQILVNLSTNAWHALEDQPGRIEIKLQPVCLDAAAARCLPGLRPGRFACLSVSDTGKGIDEAHLGRIFDPFFTTKGPGKGTGLGLSVVHGIVQAHEGAISVMNHPGRGAIFQVYFPAATAPLDSACVPVDSASPPAPSPCQSESHRILYIDDEEPLVLIATRMLRRLGHQVTGFTRATDALKSFRANPGQFDLVITDHNMPGASGLAVAGELLKLRPDLPVLLNSGHITDDLKQRARKTGIRDLLYKPNTIEEFSRTIDRLTVAASRPGACAQDD